MEPDQTYKPRFERTTEAIEARRDSGIPCTCNETGTGGCPRCLQVEAMVGDYTDEDYAYEAANSTRPKHLAAPKARIPASLRTSVYERDAYRCVVCGSWTDLTLDHIVPEAKGGPTTFENLQTMCRSHNSGKGTRLQ